MAIASSGALTLHAIRDEFGGPAGGTATLSLGSYYRDPDGPVSGNNSDVPAGGNSGPISFGDFYSGVFQAKVTYELYGGGGGGGAGSKSGLQINGNKGGDGAQSSIAFDGTVGGLTAVGGTGGLSGRRYENSLGTSDAHMGGSDGTDRTAGGSHANPAHAALSTQLENAGGGGSGGGYQNNPPSDGGNGTYGGAGGGGGAGRNQLYYGGSYLDGRGGLGGGASGSRYGTAYKTPGVVVTLTAGAGGAGDTDGTSQTYYQDGAWQVQLGSVTGDGADGGDGAPGYVIVTVRAPNANGTWNDYKQSAIQNTAGASTLTIADTAYTG